MKKLLFSILVILSVNVFGQCSLTVTASYTAPTCSVCCNGAITATVLGIPCINPTGCFTLQPLGLLSCTGVWNNLCSGSYTVAAQDACCLATCVFTLTYSPTNILETENSTFAINTFPNPASNALFISSEKNRQENSEIEIINYLGQSVLRTRFKKELDISDLPNGVYFLQLKNPQGQVAMKRLVIAR